jgi:hypothetical protein
MDFKFGLVFSGPFFKFFLDATINLGLNPFQAKRQVRFFCRAGIPLKLPHLIKGVDEAFPGVNHTECPIALHFSRHLL